MASSIAASSRLKPELVSLVHHVHLNATGWWKRVVQRVVLVTFFGSPAGIAKQDVRDVTVEYLSTAFPHEAIDAAISDLMSRGDLVEAGDLLRLSEATRSKLSGELSQATEGIKRAKKRFEECLRKAGLSHDANDVWDRFIGTWLFPTICEIGARTYHLVGGTLGDWESKRDLAEFLAGYSSADAPAMRTAIELFFDPSDIDVRAYVFRLLDSYYTLEASGLGKPSLDALSAITGNDTHFTLLLDTNVILSLIGLDGPAERDAVLSLLKLVAQIGHRVRAKVYVTAPTLEETLTALTRKQQAVSSIRMSPKMATAVLRSGGDSTVAALARASLEANVTLDGAEYFKPFSGALLPYLKQFDIELYNDRLAIDIGAEEVVQAEIERQYEYERSVYGSNAKSRTKIGHDVALWHFVARKRPAHFDGISHAGYWLVTEDNRVISYDRARQRELGRKVPICLHPLGLTQLLHLWSGRTPELEAAMVGGMRMSMFVPAFGDSSEAATIRILSALSRYENVGDLTEQTIVHLLLNEALRSRLLSTEIETEQLQLVKEAVLAENLQLQASLTELTHRTQETATALHRVAKHAEQEAERARTYELAHNAAATALSRKEVALSAAGVAIANRDRDLRDLTDEHAQLTSALDQERRARTLENEQRRYQTRWVLLPVGAAAIAFFIASRSALVTGLDVWQKALAVLLTLLLIAELATSVGLPNSELQRLPFLRGVKRARKALRWLSGLLLFALVSGGIASAVGKPHVVTEPVRPSSAAPSKPAEEPLSAGLIQYAG